MATTYSEFDAFPNVMAATMKQKILASTDWAHLQLSTGTQNTTLAALVSAGAVSISTTATIPSGSVVVIGNGSANPEVRVTTGVSGAGPFTVTFADALVNGYANAAPIGVGSYVKATTTRGSQMVVDLNDATPTILSAQFGVYRTHDGTTAVDKIVRYMAYKNQSTGAVGTIPVHCTVSAGKEHLYIEVEGPRFSETFADSTVDVRYGSFRSNFLLCDVAPYHGSDTIPAVVLVGAYLTVGNNVQDSTVKVSRNQGNTASWVTARLYSVFQPAGAGFASGVVTYQPQAKGDSNSYLWPWLVIEDADGYRGRLSKVFYGGNTVAASAGDPTPLALGQDYTYGGVKYRLRGPVGPHGANTNTWSYGFQNISNGNTPGKPGPMIAVPVT